MSEKKKFTSEQVEQFNSNPYTHKATETKILFTVEFKEFFYEKIKEGKLSNPKIFEAAGYDPKVLGLSRMDNVRIKVLQEAKSPKGFTKPRGLSYVEEMEQLRQKTKETQDLLEKAELLEQRVAHLEAQVEFLKKTASLRKTRI